MHHSDASTTVTAPNTSAVDAWLETFNTIYTHAAGDVSRIPWAHARPSPTLVRWLNERSREFVRCGARACVVGCGLGQDALELARRGFDVTAFDACPAAIDQAREMHASAPEADAIEWRTADVLDLPSNLQGRFDLVVEVHTLQSLPVVHRSALALGIASLLHRRGVLVAIARGRDSSIPADQAAGPPFGFAPGELESLFDEVGLTEVAGGVEIKPDSNRPPITRYCGTFARA